MSFRGDRDALLAKTRALEERLEATVEELERARAETAEPLLAKIRELEERLEATQEVEEARAESGSDRLDRDFARIRKLNASTRTRRAGPSSDPLSASDPLSDSPARRSHLRRRLAAGSLLTVLVTIVFSVVYMSARPTRAGETRERAASELDHADARPSPPAAEPHPALPLAPRTWRAIVVVASPDAPVSAGASCRIAIRDLGHDQACGLSIGCPDDLLPGTLSGRCLLDRGELAGVTDVWLSRRSGFMWIDGEVPIVVDATAGTATVGDWRWQIRLSESPSSTDEP